ncbi:uncharacterized protein LOC143300029 [Babylonia areolata]|uniref:uncharacterized protein LOC143300029 n=1 Tax=Babylonia areolata TaxID=304850 RepID=UPI003FCF1477
MGMTSRFLCQPVGQGVSAVLVSSCLLLVSYWTVGFHQGVSAVLVSSCLLLVSYWTVGFHQGVSAVLVSSCLMLTPSSDVSMPRKLLADSDRGWYGWEGQDSSVLRMSSCLLWECRHRMDLEKFRHQAAMGRLHQVHRMDSITNTKALRNLQDEYSRIRAERTVLQQHAFGKYDPMHQAPPSAPPPGPAPRDKPRPRRPKTERTTGPQTPNTDRLPKRNSLPDLHAEGGGGRGNKSTSEDKVAAADCARDSGSASARIPMDEIPATTTPAPVEPGGKRQKGMARRGQKPSSSIKGFFLTDSDIITSSVPEEEEEGEEDDVFLDPVMTHHTIRQDRHVTSGDSGAACGQMEEADAVSRREGQGRKDQGFHGVDHMLHDDYSPATPSTPTNSATPHVPALQATPSVPSAADTSSDPVPSASSRHRSHKGFSSSPVTDVSHGEDMVRDVELAEGRPQADSSKRGDDSHRGTANTTGTERITETSQPSPVGPSPGHPRTSARPPAVTFSPDPFFCRARHCGPHDAGYEASPDFAALPPSPPSPGPTQHPH